MYKTLRKIRIALSLLVLVVLTAGLAGAGGVIGAVAGQLGAGQLTVACLGGSLLWVVVWLIITLLCGRIYCSTVCPAGTCMDIAARLGALLKRPATPLGRQYRGYRYTTAQTFVRMLMLMVYVEAVALSSATLTHCLDPYADFRTLVAVFGGVSLTGWIAALAILGVGVVVSIRGGRALCNTVCPVGSALSAVSAVSLLHFDINPDLCTHCGACEEVCKSRCIHQTVSIVDNSRCVVCFNCVAACPNGAITWRRGRHRLQWPLLQKIAPRTRQTAIDATSGPAATNTVNLHKKCNNTSTSCKG